MCFYIKDLSSHKIKVDRYMRINSFVPEGLVNLIRNTPKNSYILGVSYIHGDNQICISGHPKQNETLIQGFKRELREELYITTPRKLRPLFQIENNYFYKFSINSCVLCNAGNENKHEDREERVVVCVYGSELEIFRYMIQLGIKHPNSDGICSIWAGPKNKILRLIN